jgi:lysophospholipase L1-like esterase
MMGFSRQVSIDDFVSSPTYLSWPFEARLEADDVGAAAAEILAQNPPTYFRRNLANMIAVAREHDVAIMLATWAYSPFLNDYAAREHYQQGFAENNQVVVEVANSHGVPVFHFAAVMSPDAEYWADGRHSSEAGAALKATLFAEFIHSQGLIK